MADTDISIAKADRIEVLLIVYRPDVSEIQAALDALLEAHIGNVPISVCLWHNDAGPQATSGLQPLIDKLTARALPLRVAGGQGNLGFGRGVNAALAGIDAPYVFLLNQDAAPEPQALQRLWRTALADDPQVAAWELRQIPYEHPKDYDPVSGETGWFSGAAVLLRTAALRAVGGFEPRFFMYCEDVDLSWRLRCAGWRLRYLPRCAVVHRTYRYPGEAKPLAVLGGVYANLCIRARFAGRRHVLDGLREARLRWRRPPSFPGERQGLMRALLQFAVNYPYFRRTRCSAPDFMPCFNGSDYEMRRDGSFHPFLSHAEQRQPRPAVAVLVSASGAPADLEAWLTCIENQTHRPLEVFVSGGHSPDRRTVCDAWQGRLNIRTLPPTQAPLECVAAVHAQADWWLIFDDERVLPYADHAEVLLEAAVQNQAAGAVALHWVIQADPSRGREAHRMHAPRTTIGGPASKRPSRLMHRAAATLPDTTRQLVEVDKLTTLRYAPSST